ncbi:hypothetical protein GOP47_0000443 [Adiantum capillus-veneris]|uniref:Bifunctional inhibitor/plant lipid transfer protein/seed storage helical domain-containing protein n=1 Tax=Adiantum capillus-veneris TaxID=13818 RepID=A0A9D4VDW8_ADICA|nr:hypothetical protein GOP47_0000443 [Adiantum capillus-veneris]
MGGSRAVVVAAVVMMMLLCVASADVCDNTRRQITACQSYGLGLVTRPSPQCCGQVTQLSRQTQGNTPLRRQICNCFQGYIKLLGAQRFNSLLSICQVKLGYTISANTKCSQIR